MKSNFKKYMDRLLSAEGGFTDDRSDVGNWTGGRIGIGALNGTKFGISAASYPYLNIKALTRDEAIAIYNRDFWDAIGADLLPPAVGYSALDGAVNSGVTQSIRWLQQAAGVADDGRWGPITVSAIAGMEPNDLLLKYNAYRLRFMVKLSAWKVYGAGWANRIAQNLLYGAEDN